MTATPITVFDLVELVCSNIPRKQWFLGTYLIDTKTVKIKVFGRWLQRIEVAGIITGLQEFKTTRDFRTELTRLLTELLAITPFPTTYSTYSTSTI